MHSADACLQSLQVHCSTACRRLSPVRPNYPSCSCEPRVLAIPDDCFRLVITSQDCVSRLQGQIFFCNSQPEIDPFKLHSCSGINKVNLRNCMKALLRQQLQNETQASLSAPDSSCSGSRHWSALPSVQTAPHAICSELRRADIRQINKCQTDLRARERLGSVAEYRLSVQ